MRDEFFASPEFRDRGYDRETLDQVFDEIVANDFTEESEAHKFYEQMWNKLTKRVNKFVPLKPKFLDQTPKDPYQEALRKPDMPESYNDGSADGFVMDHENYNKMHDYAQSRIGRYPHGFRHFENYANYSQLKKDANI